MPQIVLGYSLPGSITITMTEEEHKIFDTKSEEEKREFLEAKLGDFSDEALFKGCSCDEHELILDETPDVSFWDKV